MEPDTKGENLTLEEQYSFHQKCQELLSAKNNTQFTELVANAEMVGFLGRYADSSHWVGRHPTHELGPPAYNKVNFQKMGGNKAKPYQVEQLVKFIQNAAPKQSR